MITITQNWKICIWNGVLPKYKQSSVFHQKCNMKTIISLQRVLVISPMKVSKEDTLSFAVVSLNCELYPCINIARNSPTPNVLTPKVRKSGKNPKIHNKLICLLHRMAKYAISTLKLFFTKKFRSFDPHPRTVSEFGFGHPKWHFWYPQNG